MTVAPSLSCAQQRVRSGEAPGVEAVHSGQRARRTVLVVEDDSDQRALTAQMLARNGFTVLAGQ